MMTFVLIGTGSQFVGLDVFKLDDKIESSGLRELRKPVIAAIACFVIINAFLAFIGIYIVRYPPGNNIYVAVYGICIFFVGFLPMIVEGGTLTGLANIPNSFIEEKCTGDGNIKVKGVKHELLNEILTFAHDFDRKSENMLDHMMCTETCPCFYEETYEQNAAGVDTYRSDAYYKYE